MSIVEESFVLVISSSAFDIRTVGVFISRSLLMLFYWHTTHSIQVQYMPQHCLSACLSLCLARSSVCQYSLSTYRHQICDHDSSFLATVVAKFWMSSKYRWGVKNVHSFLPISGYYLRYDTEEVAYSGKHSSWAYHILLWRAKMTLNEMPYMLHDIMPVSPAQAVT